MPYPRFIRQVGLVSLIASLLLLTRCQSAPKATSTNPSSDSVNSSISSKTAPPAPSKAPVKKHVPHANEVRNVLRDHVTLKEFNAYRDQWRDWPKDTGKFKTTIKLRFPGGEFLIWWKPDKHTPDATMSAYRLTRYRD